MLTMVFCGNCVFFTFVLTVYLIGEGATNGRSDNKDARKDWKKKDLTDYNDADVERLFEQWEVRTANTFINSSVVFR